LKICFISNLFPPWDVYGAGKYVNNLTSVLSKNNEIIVITSKGPKKRNDDLSNPNLKIFELKQANIDSIYSIQSNKKISIKKRILWHLLDIWNFSNYKQINDILKHEKPDLVQTNTLKGLSPSVFSSIKKQKIPHIHVLHDYELISKWVTLLRNGKQLEFNLLDKLYMLFLRNISSKVSGIISPSSFILNYYEKMGYFKHAKKFLIPHGIEQKNGIEPKKGCGKEFVFLGRLHESKGIQIAINAFKDLKEKDIKLHIIGGGDMIDLIKKQSQNDKRLIVHGYLAENELNKIIDQCQYGIVPSIWHEPFGYVTLELMNRGLPVLGSNLGAIPELIQDGKNGFLFNPNDSNSLKKLIQNVYLDTHHLNEMSMNAIKFSKKFTLKEQVKNTLNAYKSVLN